MWSYGAEAPGSHLVVLGIILVLAALFMQRGLVGMFEDVWTRLRTRRTAA